MSVNTIAAFAALGDPIRATIVDRLSSGRASVSELASLFDVSLAAVSRHIGVLEAAGVVSREREGRVRWVTLLADPLDDAADWLERRRLRLEARYRRLDDLLAQSAREDTEGRKDTP